MRSLDILAALCRGVDKDTEDAANEAARVGRYVAGVAKKRAEADPDMAALVFVYSCVAACVEIADYGSDDPRAIMRALASRLNAVAESDIASLAMKAREEVEDAEFEEEN